MSTVDVPLAELDEDLAKSVAAVRTGAGSITSEDVPRLLGRPARSYATWATECYPRP